RSWRHLVAAVVIVAIAAAGCVAIRTTERNRVAVQDSHRADLAAIQVANTVNQASGYADALRRYLSGHIDVTPEAFSNFAGDVLGNSGLSEVAWVQPVTEAARAAYERTIGASIMELAADGTSHRAPTRSVYYPATLAATRDRPLIG